MRWSKLKKRVENLLDPGVKLQLGIVRMNSQYGNTNIPRLWITKNKEILWDYPGNFKEDLGYYPYDNEIRLLMDRLEQYCLTARDQVFKLKDKRGLYEVLRSNDRRFEHKTDKLSDSRTDSEVHSQIS